jgi:hypothetical protein
MPTSLRRMLCAIVLISSLAGGQTQTQSTTQPTTQPADSAITQIRKTVAFIKLTYTDGGQAYTGRGTGFFVSYPESRIEGKPASFIYLVTNRHVALCWNGRGQPMHVTSVSVSVNLNTPVDGKFVAEFTLNPAGNVAWTVPEDDSVDLAVYPVSPDLGKVDVKWIPTTMFATKDVLEKSRIHEGEPLFFSGFFTQFPGTKRMQPIVRQGIIAMMPDEQIPFVGMARRLYLADLHAFAGNSGSPAFINLAGMHEGSISSGLDYRLLGIVNGEVFEDEDFNLTLTATSVEGKALANSGVSTIVPVDDLKALLDDPRLQRMRDEEVRRWKLLNTRP